MAVAVELATDDEDEEDEVGVLLAGTLVAGAELLTTDDETAVELITDDDLAELLTTDEDVGVDE